MACPLLVNNMQSFGSVSYSYEHHKSQLEPQYKQCVFVGYDEEAPAYLFYYPGICVLNLQTH